MQTIDCTDPSLNLVLPPCAAVPSAARLTRRGFEDVPVTASVEDRVVTLAAVPAGLTRGVWTLAIDSECGCYTAPVFVDICAPPAFQAEHIGEEREPIQVCCPDEDDLCAS